MTNEDIAILVRLFREFNNRELEERDKGRSGHDTGFGLRHLAKLLMRLGYEPGPDSAPEDAAWIYAFAEEFDKLRQMGASAESVIVRAFRLGSSGPNNSEQLLRLLGNTGGPEAIALLTKQLDSRVFAHIQAAQETLGLIKARNVGSPTGD